MAISGIASLILYDDGGQAVFAFYEDFGGVIQYATTSDPDFDRVYTLASGGNPPSNPIQISPLNLKKNR